MKYYYVAAILFLVAFYFIGSFIAWELNPYHWSQGGRIIYGICMGVVVIYIEDISEKRLKKK